MDWRILLAHRHWFTVRLGAQSVRLCARCSGTVIGYFLSFLLLRSLDLTGFYALPLFQQFFLSFSLGIPSSIDWLAQTWGLRESTNSRRLVAGFLIGSGAALLTMSALPSLWKTLTLTGPASAIILAGYLGRRLRSS
jgi:uncharacterized membrane protein